jgi:CRP-like cAMP-binding protein
METIPITGGMRDRVLEALAQSAWFQALQQGAEPGQGASNVEQIVKLADLLRFSPGEVILEQGYPSDAFFLLLEGAAQVRLESGDGVAVGRLSPPTSFGEIGLLLDERRTATVKAIDEILALRFSAASFQTMMKTIPEFGMETSRYLAQRLKTLSEQIALL